MPTPAKNPTFRDRDLAYYDSALQIMKTVFPQQYASVPQVPVVPEYMPEAYRGIYSRDPQNPKDKGTIRINPWDGDVIDMVETLLHETHHAQQDTPEALDVYRTWSGTNHLKFGDVSHGLELADERIGAMHTPEYEHQSAVVAKLKKQALDLGLPSVSDSNQPLDEILATLSAVTTMQAQGLHGMKHEKAVNEIMKDPDVANWVARNRDPMIPSFMPAPAETSWFSSPKKSQAELKEAAAVKTPTPSSPKPLSSNPLDFLTEINFNLF